ncbi:hypothetical protein GPECTOR_2g1288 [Gonium pectorale]|uniref:BRCT domain-containing protein n=1 Tax=Gonium pectorale TaxID=33097 RepID=A0A150H1J7_GONPE|nr:hypothetical protein GPECTOR_2g1288 [Gonium pectorale]|eukprot:KXZ55738.1 hypothetical protein GPECTOR_2g1288 [Gonium pectorale]
MSHLVVKLGPDGVAAARTVKYLRAVVLGCWVVGMEWVEACLAAGRLVPEGPYEAKVSHFQLLPVEPYTVPLESWQGTADASA